MPISSQEIAQMAAFMRALNGDAAQPVVEQTTSAIRTTGEPPQSNAIQEMKTILERFHTAADDAAKRVHQDATFDPELREALITDRTHRGARIGGWEINVREDGSRKFYDVVQTQGNACIASDLLLYEAAHGLARILNDGGKLNSREAIGLLRAEQDYASALNDAVLYKHYLVKKPGDPRTAVFEAKYSAAKQRALTARDKVFAISGSY